MTEPNPKPTPETLQDRLDAGKLRWMTNIATEPHIHMPGFRQVDNERHLDNLRETYGAEAVIIDSPMVMDDGEPTGQTVKAEGRAGVYVDAAAYAAKNPDQAQE